MIDEVKTPASPNRDGVRRMIPATLIPPAACGLKVLDRLRSYEGGANSFVRKPLEFGEFAGMADRLGIRWLATNEPPHI